MSQHILVLRGGSEPGKRHRTMLARVVSYDFEKATYSAHILRAKGETKTVQKIPTGEVVRSWHYKPSGAEVRQARSTLEVQ